MDSLHPHYKYRDFFSQQPLENKKRRTVKPSFALFFNFQLSIVNPKFKDDVAFVPLALA